MPTVRVCFFSSFLPLASFFVVFTGLDFVVTVGSPVPPVFAPADAPAAAGSA